MMVTDSNAVGYNSVNWLPNTWLTNTHATRLQRQLLQVMPIAGGSKTIMLSVVSLATITEAMGI